MEKFKKAEADSNKKLREEIEQKLEAALVSLKDKIGEKKFKRRIKKASKILGKSRKAKAAKAEKAIAKKLANAKPATKTAAKTTKKG
jgi:hypothetical protein